MSFEHSTVFPEESYSDDKHPERRPPRSDRWNSRHIRSTSGYEHGQDQAGGMAPPLFSTNRTPARRWAKYVNASSDNRHGSRKGALLYHIQGRSLRDQINRMAQEGTSRISEDAEKNTSCDNVLPPSDQPNHHLQIRDYASTEILTDQFANSSSSPARSSFEHGTLGLIVAPGLFTFQESRTESISEGITSTVQENSLDAPYGSIPTTPKNQNVAFFSPSIITTSLKPTPRRRTPKEGQGPSTEGGFARKTSIHEDGIDSSINNEAVSGVKNIASSLSFDSTLGAKMQPDDPLQTVEIVEQASTECEHEEITNDVNNLKKQVTEMDRSHSNSSRSISAFVSACNEP